MKKVLIAAMMALLMAAVVSPAWAAISPNYMYSCQNNQATIPAGQGLHNTHYYPGDPLQAWATLLSSTGPVNFGYTWQNPYLYTAILNFNSYSVTVTFETCAQYN